MKELTRAAALLAPALAYLLCLALAQTAHPSAYAAACLGPVFGLLALAAAARPSSRGGRA